MISTRFIFYFSLSFSFQFSDDYCEYNKRIGNCNVWLSHNKVRCVLWLVVDGIDTIRTPANCGRSLKRARIQIIDDTMHIAWASCIRIANVFYILIDSQVNFYIPKTKKKILCVIRTSFPWIKPLLHTEYASTPNTKSTFVAFSVIYWIQAYFRDVFYFSINFGFLAFRSI